MEHLKVTVADSGRTGFALAFLECDHPISIPGTPRVRVICAIVKFANGALENIPLADLKAVN